MFVDLNQYAIDSFINFEKIGDGLGYDIDDMTTFIHSQWIMLGYFK